MKSRYSATALQDIGTCKDQVSTSRKDLYSIAVLEIVWWHSSKYKACANWRVSKLRTWAQLHLLLKSPPKWDHAIHASISERKSRLLMQHACRKTLLWSRAVEIVPPNFRKRNYKGKETPGQPPMAPHSAVIQWSIWCRALQPVQRDLPTPLSYRYACWERCSNHCRRYEFLLAPTGPSMPLQLGQLISCVTTGLFLQVYNCPRAWLLYMLQMSSMSRMQARYCKRSKSVARLSTCTDSCYISASLICVHILVTMFGWGNAKSREAFWTLSKLQLKAYIVIGNVLQLGAWQIMLVLELKCHWLHSWVALLHWWWDKTRGNGEALLGLRYSISVWYAFSSRSWKASHNVTCLGLRKSWDVFWQSCLRENPIVKLVKAEYLWSTDWYRWDQTTL